MAGKGLKSTEERGSLSHVGSLGDFELLVQLPSRDSRSKHFTLGIPPYRDFS